MHGVNIDRSLRVLRVAHHAPVSAWRQRERELIAAGVDVSLVSSYRWNEGGTVVTFSPEADAFVLPVRTFGDHPNLFVYDPRPLWRLLGQDWDLIDLHEEPCSLATAELLTIRWLRRCRAPYVLYSAQNIAKRYPLPFRWTERWALRGAAGAYVCNDAAARILCDKGLRGPAENIPLGVDIARFAPAERAEPAGGLRIGYVGRLEDHKGVHVLVEALASRPQWELVLAGDGPQAEALDSRAAALGIPDRVHFHGHVPQHELPAFYRSLDVLAVPSLPTAGWLEQFGRVVIEAMASGVPVVASDSGALAEVMGEVGVLVPPGEPRLLASGLSTMEDPAVWRAHREAGLARASQFTWEAVARQQSRLYDRVTASRPPMTTAQGPVAGAEGPSPGRIEVVVVAYGPQELLAGCLSSLGRELPVTIVDNSSSPETAVVAREAGARYLDPGRNLGFAAGVNHGLAALGSQGFADVDILLLNPDAQVGLDGVRTLQRALHARPDLACVAPAQTHPVSGDRARVAWSFPSPAGAMTEAVGLGRLRRREDFVIGSVLLLRGGAIDDVGVLDERFFLYSEETDWQKRARERGWDVATVPQAAATHVGAGTGGDPRVREGYFHASLEHYVRKHHGSAGWKAFRAAMVGGAGVRAMLLTGDGRAAARRRLRLYLRGPVRAAEAAT